MRTLQRNKLPVYYALYVGLTEERDSDGNLTGEKKITYTDPIPARMNVSGGRGMAAIEAFGVENPFTRTAVTDDLETDFNTETVFWYEADPIEKSFNYRVTGVATTINGRIIALKEVDPDEDSGGIVSA